MTNNRKDTMKKYKVGISELGYEQVVEAEDEQEAENGVNTLQTIST